MGWGLDTAKTEDTESSKTKGCSGHVEKVLTMPKFFFYCFGELQHAPNIILLLLPFFINH